jgi:hypothetical protein
MKTSCLRWMAPDTFGQMYASYKPRVNKKGTQLKQCNNKIQYEKINKKVSRHAP